MDIGPPCPVSVPGHAHADCLSIDIFYRGKAIIVDTGNCLYDSGPTRLYERGTAAHNTIMLNGENQTELWGSFRVGQKAMPQQVLSGSQNG
jgi:uncharacterized heparinase superfamily protein